MNLQFQVPVIEYNWIFNNLATFQHTHDLKVWPKFNAKHGFFSELLNPEQEG